MSMNFNNPYQSYSHQSIWAGIKNSFKEGSVLSKLIYINLGVFLIVKLVAVVSFLMGISPQEGNFLMNWLSLPADSSTLLYRPWTIFSYMFLHESFIHILFNMLWLFVFKKKKIINYY